MAADTTVLKQTDPRKAEVIENLSKAFEGSYDLTKRDDMQKFVEGLVEFGKFVASTSSHATLSVTVGGSGVTGINVHAIPHDV